jgi:hypothetical protein
VYSPIPVLNELCELQEQVGGEFLSMSFELRHPYNDRSSFEALDLNDPAFLDRIIVFAQANGSGSEYAIWRVDDREDRTTLPIVAFGDEGGECVVARTLPELCQILTYDRDPMIDEEIYFGSRDGEDHSGGHEQFVEWVRARIGLEPTDDPDSIVELARREYGARFTAWIKPFLQAKGHA